MESYRKNIRYLNEPDKDLLCSACTDPLTEPYLTDCGHHICHTCRGRLLACGKPECPKCCEQDVLTDARLNKHLQRQVNSLKVRCQHHEVGCQWVGELRYLQEHLDPVMRKCGFILLACPLDCGERIRSCAMKDHILSDCSKRFYLCEHCGYYNEFDIVTEQHFPVCDMVPVECPNQCSAFVSLKRLELERHLEEQCPLQVIPCPFTSAGCIVQLPRREMEEHEKEAVHRHLRMVMLGQVLSKPELQLQIAALPLSTGFLMNLPPVVFTIVDFTKMKEFDTEWVSPSFYSHPQGYKLCLVVYPNGTMNGSDTHMSVYVGISDEEHGDHLVWPLNADVAVEILNWREDNGHYERMMPFNCLWKAKSEIGTNRSLVYSQFIPHSSLSYNSTTNTEYLQNDCVRLRVSKVILYSTALLNKTPSWQNPYVGHKSKHEFTMTDFSKRKEFNNEYYSSPFYTRYHGHKLCVEVDANGYRSGKGTHVSVFVTLMAGDYDDLLEWPFIGKLEIELLNWRENKKHVKRTTSIVASDRFFKLNEGVYYGQGKGYDQFITHSSLGYNIERNTEYLHEDCLRFRVTY